MKHFLFIPTCALLTLGVLTSCQKEEKSAQQLAEELTAELQKVVDYKTAEAVAPRVEALNKRFQNASVRVFSMDANALAASTGDAYADAVTRLIRELGRVQASKPVTSYDAEVDDIALVRTVGVGAGAEIEAPARDQYAKGQLYIYNSDSESNNNPPEFTAYYGSEKLANALSYTASSSDNGAFKFASEEDVPAIPAAEEVEPDVATAADVAGTDVPEPGADASDAPATADEEPADEEPADDTIDEEPADDTIDEEPADEEPADDTIDEEPADEEPADDTIDEEPADEEPADDTIDEEPAADEEPADEPVDEDMGVDMESSDDASSDDASGDDMDLMDDEEVSDDAIDELDIEL